MRFGHGRILSESGNGPNRAALSSTPRRLKPFPAPLFLSKSSPIGTLSAVRIDDYKYRFTDQPGGWLGGTIKVDWPILTNIRFDPFERMNLPNGANGSLAFYNWFVFEFWRFQFVQKEVAEVAQTAIDYPPMQKGASFNLEAVKAQIEKAIAAHAK
jgi:arylsulfatase